MMNEEREALRYENAELRKRLDEAMAKCAALELDNGDLNERLLAAQRSNDHLNA